MTTDDETRMTLTTVLATDLGATLMTTTTEMGGMSEMGENMHAHHLEAIETGLSRDHPVVAEDVLTTGLAPTLETRTKMRKGQRE